jgi:hypothetical protein
MIEIFSFVYYVAITTYTFFDKISACRIVFIYKICIAAIQFCEHIQLYMKAVSLV